MSMQRKTASSRTRPPRKKTVAFSVRDYPFYYMHAIIIKNNRNIGEALKSMKLTPAIWRILALLQEEDGVTVGELSDESLIERTLLSREIESLQAEAMRHLTATERTAFTLRHMEDRSTTEIAAVLEIAPNAAKQAVFRAVQKLRRSLAPLRVNL